jgi:hypothetical protein
MAILRNIKMPPRSVSPHTREPRRTGIIIPPEVFGISKTVTVTDTTGTNIDVSDRVISIEVTGHSIREGTSSCTIKLDNSDGYYINTEKTDFVFKGGETLLVKIDYTGGNKRIFKGKINAPLLDFDKEGTRLILQARTVPEYADRKIKITIDGSAVQAVKDIIDTYLSNVLSYDNFDTNLGSETTEIKASYNGYIISFGS